MAGNGIVNNVYVRVHWTNKFINLELLLFVLDETLYLETKYVFYLTKLQLTSMTIKNDRMILLESTSSTYKI
jgi:hypothetical protein